MGGIGRKVRRVLSSIRMSDLVQFVLRESLDSGQILNKVYSSLGGRTRYKEVRFVGKSASYNEKLDKRLCLMIADDSDYHRSRSGYMAYHTLRITQFGGNQFLMGLGYKAGDYPGKEFAGDIIAVPSSIPSDVINNSPREKLTQLVKETFYHLAGDFFRPSLVIAMADGRLVFPESTLGYNLWETVDTRVRELVAGNCVRDGRLLSCATLAPVVCQPAEYKREVVGVLVEGIEKVLTGYEQKPVAPC